MSQLASPSLVHFFLPGGAGSRRHVLAASGTCMHWRPLRRRVCTAATRAHPCSPAALSRHDHPCATPSGLTGCTHVWGSPLAGAGIAAPPPSLYRFRLQRRSGRPACHVPRPADFVDCAVHPALLVLAFAGPAFCAHATCHPIAGPAATVPLRLPCFCSGLPLLLDPRNGPCK